MPSNLSVLHHFNGCDGSDPRGSLTLSENEMILYGVTSLGGINNNGTIFSIPIDVGNYSEFTTLHSFENSEKDGSGIQPHHNSMYLRDGKLYGATLYGGSLDNPRKSKPNKPKGNGNLFSIKTDGTKYTVIHPFNGWGKDPFAKDGARAHSPFIVNEETNIAYGMTSGGGSKNDGTIYSFELDKPNSTYQILHSFKKSTGKTPHGQLAFNDDKTMLYGMTRKGGAKDEDNGSGNGVIFSFDIENKEYDPILKFDGENGAVNTHGFLSLWDGNFYGTTSQGGEHSNGTLFSINEDGDFKQLHSFGEEQTDGANPYGSLTLVNGKFYGTTQHGGENGDGTVFELDPDTGIFTNLASLDPAIGKAPEDNLIANDQGTMLYGLAQQGGMYDKGTIFSVSIN